MRPVKHRIKFSSLIVVPNVLEKTRYFCESSGPLEVRFINSVLMVLSWEQDVNTLRLITVILMVGHALKPGLRDISSNCRTAESSVCILLPSYVICAVCS